MDSLAPRSKIFWSRLPAEIRLLILNFSLHTASADRELSRFAVVSKEWQGVVERQNFATLRLTPSCLAEFPSRTHRNQHLVSYIWFCLELKKYDCGSGLRSTTMKSRTDDSILASGFQDLFSILSTWETGRGILLDISVYSPSDFDHWRQYSPLRPDIPLHECGRSHGVDQALLLNDAHSEDDWITGNEDCICRLSSYSSDYFGMIGNELSIFDGGEQEARWWQGLPLVPVVTGVILRQQTRRQWNPITLTHMFSRLPRLHEIYYEPWKDINPDAPRFFDELILNLLLDFQHFFECLASKDVQKLAIFGNFHQTDLDAISGSEHDQTLTRAISQMASESSLRLEHFSGAFLIEASPFFSSRKPSWNWDNLQSITLSSQLLAPESDLTDIGDLLEDAAAAAMRMPRLNTMEIWNGREGLASLFQYQSCRGQTNATLTWRGTWELSIPNPVIWAWRAVAQKHGARGLYVSRELLDIRENLQSHGDAIHYLRLSTPVIRPVSLQQIRMDHDIRNTWNERRGDWRETYLRKVASSGDPNNRGHQDALAYLTARFASPEAD